MLALSLYQIVLLISQACVLFIKKKVGWEGFLQGLALPHLYFSKNIADLKTTYFILCVFIFNSFNYHGAVHKFPVSALLSCILSLPLQCSCLTALSVWNSLLWGSFFFMKWSHLSCHRIKRILCVRELLVSLWNMDGLLFLKCFRFCFYGEGRGRINSMKYILSFKTQGYPYISNKLEKKIQETLKLGVRRH